MVNVKNADEDYFDTVLLRFTKNVFNYNSLKPGYYNL